MPKLKTKHDLKKWHLILFFASMFLIINENLRLNWQTCPKQTCLLNLYLFIIMVQIFKKCYTTTQKSNEISTKTHRDWKY